MSIEFPLGMQHTRFGTLSDPRIPVTVPTLRGDARYRFLVDTGATFAVASRTLAEEVGFDFLSMPQVRMVGVEQGTVPARFGWLRIRIAEVEISVRCMFVDRRQVPFILGRADFLDRFVLTVDQPRRKILLDPA
jgi:predicted aspartyl protease